MNTTTESLDRLIEQLSRKTSAATPTTGPGDAIDEVLSSAPRQSDVPDLSRHPVVQQFRRDLIDGFIRVDTARQLLDLLSLVVSAMAVR
ncbi:MAG: hypothetical protein JXB13_03110 [Phycisphaerae bacterium]|nr:hypothetical protein [Phycisphaerae bacterium]